MRKRIHSLMGTSMVAFFHGISILPSAHSVPANPLAFSESQPDGSFSPLLHHRGDGVRGSYLFDSNGYQVLQNSDGWFVYAGERESGKRDNERDGGRGLRERRDGKAGGYVVGEIDPSTAGIPKGRIVEPSTVLKQQSESALDYSQSAQGGDRRKLLQTSGDFHNLVILIRFSDHTSRSLPSQSDYDKLYNMDGTDSIVAPTGSVQQVYRENSYGALTVKTTVYGWVTVSKPEAYYANGNHGFSKLKEAIKEALDILEGDPSISLSDFDLDDNNSVDGFGVLHSGYGAEFGGTDCNGQLNENRIWSHKGGVDWKSPSEDIRVSRYYVSSGLRGKCDGNIVRMGVICHELGHYIGLPDLYDPTFDGAGLGHLDFMSQSWGVDGSGAYPPLLSAWSKAKVGWAMIETITSNGNYEIEASYKSSKVYRIDEGYPEGEYLLIENRQPHSYDSQLPQGGIAIWHVDENQNLQELRGFPQQNGWPENGKHYEVALLSADGKYDMERGINQGDEKDLWHSGSKKTELKPGSDDFPSTDSYQLGSIAQTGVRLYNFSASGDNMTFSVSGLTAETTKTPTTSPTHSPTKNPTINPTNTPTQSPTASPTGSPTQSPTGSPTLSAGTTQTNEPTTSPSGMPSTVPSTSTSPSSPPSSSSAPTSSPTHSPTQNPTTELERCSNLCLEPIDQSECPSTLSFPSCEDAVIGDICDAEGECGTDQYLNNCQGYDVYRRVECMMTNWMGPVDLDDNNSLFQSVSLETEPVDSGGQDQHPETDQSMTQWSDVSTNSSQPTYSTEPSFSPSSQPSAQPVSLDESSEDLQVEPMSLAEEPVEMTVSVECPFYPGWSVGLNYCLQDCQQPKYMMNNPIFEFDSSTGCCKLHYNGKDTCITKTDAASKAMTASVITLPSVGGQVWNDENGNFWRDVGELGVAGVMIDLHECLSDVWVKGTRTVGDGSYKFHDINPGKYYLKITPPAGFHLAQHLAWLDSDFDNDFIPETGMTGCHEFAAGDDSIQLDAGVILDGTDAETERVSAAANSNDPDEPIPQASYTASHSKSRSQDQTGSAAAHSGVTEQPAASLHSKSLLRGSNVATSDSTLVTIRASEDTTINSQEGTMYGSQSELRVGRESSWSEDILLMFDISSVASSYNTSAKTATLRLYALNSSPVGGLVHIANGFWDEVHVTWATAPSAGDVLGDIGLIRANEWVEVDVSGVLLEKGNGIVSFRISFDSADHSWHGKYSSKEGVPLHTPELQIGF